MDPTVNPKHQRTTPKGGFPTTASSLYFASVLLHCSENSRTCALGLRLFNYFGPPGTLPHDESLNISSWKVDSLEVESKFLARASGGSCNKILAALLLRFVGS